VKLTVFPVIDITPARKIKWKTRWTGHVARMGKVNIKFSRRRWIG
jgi:hypothetical protein